ncbi:DNA-3-methyladenine glycosylase [Pedobacter duraquae]|uniref:Putative 3-methyladenine DNA glycosylase n=1 Tax=Pedobacter duraquae TaxID=425511 RepID=A0A4R6IP54_9SPHI|nr:DNA-3-methyladenine glycosylase [Pedobacter duraquae]TDO24040.1 DNA-3-methyladenine glycosylase [Pedobacter duraquae]
MAKLPFSFYQQDDVNLIARQLLGKYLYTDIDGVCTAGIIVETEAYKGVVDKASHAYGGRFTDRTKVMYESGGIAYVYLCYGIHYLFNVVTADQGSPHAVLIRGLEPVVGLDVMQARRKMAVIKSSITAGPGALSMALGINKKLNGADLLGDQVWIEDQGLSYPDNDIATVPRVGVDYAADHASLPWRYYVKGNKYVSKPNK